MDFSLLQPDSRHRLLRDILAIKHRWLYYVVLAVDPVLRFGWIPYVAAAHELQHSSLVSFCVALAEIFRRALWVLFRVENEHCSNVAQYKASRDVPLPYRLELFVEPGGAAAAAAVHDEQQQQLHDGHETAATTAAAASTAPSLSAARSAPSPRPSPAPSSAAPGGVLATPVMRARAKSTAAQPIVGVPLDEYDNLATSRDGGDHDGGADLEAQRHSGDAVAGDHDAAATASGSAAGGASSSAVPGTPGAAGMRRRHRPSFAHKRTFSRIIAEAHKQDFEKRRRPEDEPVVVPAAAASSSSSAAATGPRAAGERHQDGDDEDDDEIDHEGVFSESDSDSDDGGGGHHGIRGAALARQLTNASARLRGDSVLGRVQEEAADAGRAGSRTGERGGGSRLGRHEEEGA
jgi:hypothetical protein